MFFSHVISCFQCPFSVVDEKDEGVFEISWTYPISSTASSEVIYFAFTFPYGYDECQRELVEMTQKFGTKEPSFDAQNGKWHKWQMPDKTQFRDMFYYRQLLTRRYDTHVY